MKLHLAVYLRAKFEVSSIILTRFRQGVILPRPPSTSKRTPKKPTQIRVKYYLLIFYFDFTFNSYNVHNSCFKGIL